MIESRNIYSLTPYARNSVGVFEWIPTKDVKRGPVKVRVRGLIGRSDAIFSKARDIVDDLDAGTYTGPKVVCITG